ncbi:hypothetical protein [Fulvivirga sediminis]|uniref:Uncharacterized protein n=1 Tax=Fulvivirga sediminis TaxID=2803949 RepID=A0A937F8I5_9BACT|nr:hypothetical protein [Fulvivirga sediminis]MBL3658281.1 hypothetical protein [Fulvivirga sediminis]
MITASFLAVALNAETLPYLKLIMLKKSLRGVESFILLVELAAFRKAIFSRLLPLGTLLDNNFSPLILLLEANLSQLEKCLPSSPLRKWKEYE